MGGVVTRTGLLRLITQVVVCCYGGGVITRGVVVTWAELCEGRVCNFSLCMWSVCFEQGGIVTREVVVTGVEFSRGGWL